MRATKAIIDIPSLQHNLQMIKALAPKSEIMAVLKADAYGHGILEMGRQLGEVSCLGVACLQEAIILREGGVKTDIVLLEGFFGDDEIQAIIDYGFSLVVHQDNQLDVLEKLSGEHKISVWLKIDTGMHRLGFSPEQSKIALKRLENMPVVDGIGIMSHLACADDAQSSMTLEQVKLFKETLSTINSDQKPYPISMANSAAILAWPEAHFQLVRPGLLLYGVSPLLADAVHLDDGQSHGLQPVMTLVSELIAIRHIKSGETVSYGAIWTAGEDTWIGTIGIGYGDGYPRNLPNGTPVWLNGVEVPIAGRVSMDMITVDLGATTTAKIGDKAILWGKELPIEKVAVAAGTIPYELLCGITQRVPYEYWFPKND
ncbi:MAG: alanine racemase [Enterobacterales bacterium]|jgi:alanine racemase